MGRIRRSRARLWRSRATQTSGRISKAQRQRRTYPLLAELLFEGILSVHWLVSTSVPWLTTSRMTRHTGKSFVGSFFIRYRFVTTIIIPWCPSPLRPLQVVQHVHILPSSDPLLVPRLHRELRRMRSIEESCDIPTPLLEGATSASLVVPGLIAVSRSLRRISERKRLARLTPTEDLQGTSGEAIAHSKINSKRLHCLATYV